MALTEVVRDCRRVSNIRSRKYKYTALGGEGSQVSRRGTKRGSVGLIESS